MTAASVAALTVYDMVKGIERGVDDRARSRCSTRAAGAAATGDASAMSTSTRARAVITVSTSRAARRGRGRERRRRSPRSPSGSAPRSSAREVIPDDRELIAERLRHWADEGGCDLVLTTGGTGFAPDDVTPEATRDVIEREAPGIAEAMRAASREHTPTRGCSRAASPASAAATLIVNFPGSPQAIEQAGAAIAEALPHALALLSGHRHSH